MVRNDTAVPSRSIAATPAISVGTRVVDESDRVGVVEDIKDGVISYRVSGYGYLFTASANALSPEVTSLGNVRPGIDIIDSQSHIGTALHAFANGKCQYRVNGYSSPFVSSGVSAAIGQLEGFQKGLQLVDNSSRVGEILQVFENRQVSYSVPGYSSPFVGRFQDLSYEVPSRGAVKPGVYVIDPDGRIGKVMYVFKNGQAQYAVSGYSSPFVKSDCSPEVSELKGYKTGIGVVDSNLRVGVVDKVFENGNFSYKVPGYSALFVTNVSQAAHRVDTIGRIRGGVAVIDGNLRVGTALQTFENRYVEYNVPGYSSNFVSRDVSPEVEALGALKRGVIILDEADRVGTIEKVFENSRVWYPVSGYSSNFTSVADQVSPEVAEHSPYDKDRFYSTNGYQVGQIEYFFANGKFALKTVSRHRAISQVLFPEVQKLGDYATGAAVTNSAGQAGRVKMVFENGAVLMEYDFAIGSEKSETRNIALRILPDEPKERKESLHAWLNELGARFMFHRNPEPKEDFSRTAHYTILSSSYDGVKKELLDALNGEYYKGFNQRFNSVAREGVSKFLGGVPQWDAPQPGSGPSEDLPSDLPKVDLDLKNLPKKMPFDKEIKLFVRLTDLSGTSETRIVLVTVGSPIADLVSQSSDPRYALASAKGGYQDLQLKFSINEKYRGTTQPVVFTVTDEQTGQKLFSEETQVKIKRGWAFWKRR